MEELDLVPFKRVKNKWGYSNSEMQILIPCEFDVAEPFVEERAVVQKNNFWGIIDTKGDIVCDFIFDDARDFKEGYSAVKKGDKWGFVDLQGNVSVPFQYDYVQSFSCGRAVVESDGKFGFINEIGELVTKITYDLCGDFQNNYALIQEGEYYGLVDLEGNEVVPCISSIPCNYSEGLIQVSLINPDAPLSERAKLMSEYKPGVIVGHLENGKIVYRDKNGFKFNKKDFELTSKNHSCGYVDVKRNVVIGFQFELAFPFKEGLACVCIQSKFGYINKKGEFVIDAKYEDAYDFNDGFARVRLNGKWGYITQTGDPLTEFIYKEAFDFCEGVAKFERSDSDGSFITGFIDGKGSENVIYDYLYDQELLEEPRHEVAYLHHDKFSEGFIAVRFPLDDPGEDLFYIDQELWELNLERYREAYPFKNGIALVEFGFGDEVEYGYIDKYGREYWSYD